MMRAEERLKPDDIVALQARARRIRRLIVEAIAASGSGHIGGSLSCVEIMVSLFFRALQRRNDGKGWPFANRFVLSKGHADAAYYSSLCEAGLISFEELMTMRQAGSRLQGHPDPIWLPDLAEFAGGTLGQGLSFALGLALGLDVGTKVFTMLGDGELQEGQVWEAALAAPRQGASNLVAIVDWNDFQLSGPTPPEPDIRATARAWRELGWESHVCDGHQIDALIQALEVRSDRPCVIFAKTVKGNGISFMQNNNDFHGRSLTRAEVSAALEEINEVAS